MWYGGRFQYTSPAIESFCWECFVFPTPATSVYGATTKYGGLYLMSKMTPNMAKNFGFFISKHARWLNTGSGFRLGFSTSKGNIVFRATSGNSVYHHFDIILGKIGSFKF